MTLSLRHIALSGTAAICLVAGPLFAHGAWIAERHGDLYVVYGHGAADDSYDPAKVTSLVACDLALVCTEIARSGGADFVSFDKLSQPLVRIEFDNGYWSKDAAGEWQNKPKDEVSGATEGGRYFKTGTFVADHLETLPAAFGKGLEIRPLADPMALKKGDTLPVEVLIDGKPAVGAEVVVDYLNDGDGAKLVVGADGRLDVTVGSAGLNVIVAFLSTPAEDAAKADETGHSASLAFGLHHHEE